ncbi:MAG: carbamoyl-phosphate synthase large subunit [Fournierella sp.]|uniref:carbamoyl-phosphate synthase large subunit n=1 Tax=Allofournierella sp. TaxID=1940256 RepID=UPI002A81C1D7|nr:carbamoyl-phosphate synthase large subunit [Fournierella sp.]MDY4167894.1 carbamoyl-phosphate synthase large subunit [Fournierella sp.]
MPKDTSIKKVLVIGSGPIIIGQAAEFDYSGTQACRALKAEGIEVVLVNSNPATIMTDPNIADRVYVEPMTPEVIKRIIRKEKPDSILPNLGGQTGLNMAMTLAREGFLEAEGVRLLGCKPETIDRAEDRQLFKDTMEKLGEPCIPSKVVENLDDALAFAKEIDYPVIVRPAFTMGGTGGGICEDEAQLREIGTNGLRLSPIHQVLIEKCIAGWKEIEYEVMRDGKGNVITVCNMENFDPVGVHTGDSIVVAPSQTLSDKEYQMLRSSALRIITELGIEGGCNCQFALKPDSFEYAVIEVNPRVSRSSALASKATGYPIAKVATKIAIGYSLDEITNDITGQTCACFEPALDYCVVKFPKWPFDKFVYAKKDLGTQMMATGEVMAIGQSFEEALMKAVRSIELGLDTMDLPALAECSDEEIRQKLHVCDSDRSFVVFEAIKRGFDFEEIYAATKIDYWFLSKLAKLADTEKRLAAGEMSMELYKLAKRQGFTDKAIKRISGCTELPARLRAGFKMVDTCAAEFAARTPYFYSSFDEENEAAQFIADHPTDKKKVLVFGSGPIRIGQGIEFDYCSVHCVWTLKKFGYEAVIANNNPETVSTDFDTGDRLYFDPLDPESVENILETEKPWACVVQFGGQTAIKLTKHLTELGVKLLGTPADAIDEAEDRERFDELLERCGIPRPKGHTVFTTEQALAAGSELGYPVLLRPSYVLGGQNMIIAYGPDDVTEYMAIIAEHTDMENPVLVDKYLMGTECEVDAICDGEDYLIPGMMEHVERAGIHSGDSISVYPPRTLSPRIKQMMVEYTGRLAKELKVVGLVNIQYVVYNNQVYVIEVNPRSSRTVPYISKVTGVPMVELAVRCMLGEKLKDMGWGTGIRPDAPYVAVKVPVFSFEKLHGVDTQLGPEMKSTGEVLGIARTFSEALLKGLVGAGYKFQKPRSGSCCLITVKNADKLEILDTAWQLKDMGYKLYATSGTAKTLNSNMIACNTVRRISDEHPNILDLLESGLVDYVISTSDHGRDPDLDSVKMRRKAVELSVPCLTAIDTAKVLVETLRSGATLDDVELIDISTL